MEIVPFVEGAATAYSAYETGRALYRGYKRARTAMSDIGSHHAASESVVNTMQRIRSSVPSRARVRRMRRLARKGRNVLQRSALRSLYPVNAEAVNREFRALSEMDVGRGRMILGHLGHSTATNKFYTLPCHLYNLCRIPGWYSNFKDRPLSLCYLIEHNDVSQNNYVWTNRTPHYTRAGYGDDFNSEHDPEVGSNLISMAPSEFTPIFKANGIGATANDMVIRRYHYLRDMVCDLILYGEANRPTHWRIDLVSFRDNEQYVASMNEYAAFGGSIGGEYSSPGVASNGLGHALIAKYVGNPLVETDGIGKWLKVHRTWTVDIAEGKTDGQGGIDQLPRVRTRLKHTFNRSLTTHHTRYTKINTAVTDDYMDPQKATNGAFTSAEAYKMRDPVDAGGQLTHQNGDPVGVKDRVFLLIRCTDPQVINEGTGDLATGMKPTYDIRLRMRWTTQASSIVN